LQSADLQSRPSEFKVASLHEHVLVICYIAVILCEILIETVVILKLCTSVVLGVFLVLTFVAAMPGEWQELTFCLIPGQISDLPIELS